MELRNIFILLLLEQQITLIFLHLQVVGITGITQKGVYVGAGNIEVWTRSGSASGNTTSSNGWTLNTTIPNPTISGDPIYIPLMSLTPYFLVMLLVWLFILL